MSADSLPYALQESLLVALCLDTSEASERLAEILTADHFDGGEMRVIAERALKYRKEFGIPIGHNHLDDVFAEFLEARNERVVKKYTQILKGLLGAPEQLNAEYLLTRVPEFIRRQTLKAAVLKAADRYQQGGEDVADQVTEILEKGLMASIAIKANQGADVGPVIVNMSEMQMQPIFWLWPNMIPCGKLTLIAGDPKLGKSTVGLSLIATLTTAGDWPDGTRCDQASEALIATTEDDYEDTVLPRLQAMGADVKRCWSYKGYRRKVGGEVEGFDLERDLPGIERYLDAHPDIVLVLIEPVVAHLNPKFGNEVEIRRKLGMLTRLAQTRSIAVVGIMHFRKSNETSTPIHMIAGSLAYGAVARVIYGVVKDKNDPERRLFLPMGNNLAAGGLGLAYRIAGERLERGINAARIEWEGPIDITAEEAITKDQEQPKGNKRELARRWILVRVSEAPVLAEQLKEEVETGGQWSWKTVERAADELEKDKLLHRTVSGFPGKPTWSRAG
jgi:putative DNA primase/helicase